MTTESPEEIWLGYGSVAPGKDAVLVLNFHHDGESHWTSPEGLRQRLESIVDGVKPQEQWGPRLEAMRVVRYGPWWKDYQSFCARELRAYWKVTRAGEADIRRLLREQAARRRKAPLGALAALERQLASEKWEKFHALAVTREHAWSVYRKKTNAALLEHLHALQDMPEGGFPAEAWLLERIQERP